MVVLAPPVRVATRVRVGLLRALAATVGSVASLALLPGLCTANGGVRNDANVCSTTTRDPVWCERFASPDVSLPYQSIESRCVTLELVGSCPRLCGLCPTPDNIEDGTGADGGSGASGVRGTGLGTILPSSTVLPSATVSYVASGQSGIDI